MPPPCSACQIELFLDRLNEAKDREETSFIGQFGVGFYSAFMVAERVDVISRRAGSEEAYRWSLLSWNRNSERARAIAAAA